jgi:transglutaminase-like putative cysteine protease
VQVYSERGSTPLPALFISLRRHGGLLLRRGDAIDLTLPYFLLCLVSAGAGNRDGAVFFAAVALLLGAVLWPLRPRHHAASLWVALYLLAVGGGFLGQAGMVRLQNSVEASVLEIMDRFMWRYRDPHHAATAIGSLGRLKLSDRIVLRVRTERPLDSRLLLREAAYDTYNYGVWTTRDRTFTPVDPDVSGTAWALKEGEARERAVISVYMPETTGTIPLPLGTRRIADVAATEISRNPYGAVSMEIRRGWIRYAAAWTEGSAVGDPPPTESDLHVDRIYREELGQLARELGLPSAPPARRIAIVEDFFARNFTYSLTQRQRYPRGRYLSGFLFRERSGHCEMFATATALLLRTAGVPARYAVGYAVDEWSPLEGQYIARARHAHSWVLAWAGGGWRVVDTTPSRWFDEEAAGASAFEPFYDFWAWLNFRLASWRTIDDATTGETERRHLLWLILPLAALLAWRLRGRARVTRVAAASARSGPAPGTESGVLRIVRVLEGRGYVRGRGETLSAWFRRIGPGAGLTVPPSLLGTHYRWRFDPHGISAAERRHMDVEVERVLGGLGER